MSVALVLGSVLLASFAVSNLAAGFFRHLGADTDALFKAPLLARSLGEFWSRRWNLAFSEMTASCVYRPLREVFGRRTALLASFAFSGLLHEAAISVPVHAGYGLRSATSFSRACSSPRSVREAPSPGGSGRSSGSGRLSFSSFHPRFLRGVVFPLVFFSPGGASSL